MGIKVRSGARYGNRLAYNGFNMAIAIYMNFGFRILNNLLDQAAYFVHRELLEEGYQTLPMPAAHPYPFITDVIFDKTRSANLFSNRHAAVAAGIAEFGWNTLALTPDAGPRVRYVSVITEAELEPDALYEGEPICKKEKCPNPLICAKICPMGALDLKDGRELRIDDKKVYSYAKLDMTKCLWGICGLRRETLGKYDCDMPEEKDRNAFYKALSEKDLIENLERLGDGSMCGRCIMECPIGEDNS
jgi:epoxyqueuosine reductase QueG